MDAMDVMEGAQFMEVSGNGRIRAFPLFSNYFRHNARGRTLIAQVEADLNAFGFEALSRAVRHGVRYDAWCRGALDGYLWATHAGDAPHCALSSSQKLFVAALLFEHMRRHVYDPRRWLLFDLFPGLANVPSLLLASVWEAGWPRDWRPEDVTTKHAPL